MANILSKTGISNTNTVQAAHVTQSIDAFTGAVAYDISLSGSFNMTGSLIATSFTGSLLGTATTASYVQNAQTASYVLNAISSSFASTAQTLLGSVVSASNALTASFTPNALVTASVSSNTITFTKGNGTTFPLTVNTGSGGGGAAFPFTGSALITGSLDVTGSISTSGSNGTINGLFFSRGGGNVSSNISIGSTTNFSSSATGTNNFAAGNLALCKNTIGNNNTAIGQYSLRCNTSGCHNTAIGSGSLQNNPFGSYNIALGYRALLDNSQGTHNIAMGKDSLATQTVGSHNIAMGYRALYKVKNVSNSNIGIGCCAGKSLFTSCNNITIGANSLCCVVCGDNNIALGGSAGSFLSGSSSNNIIIGFGAGPSTLTDEDNKLYIASGSGTPLIKGDFAAKTVNINNALQILQSNPLPTFAASLTGSIAFSSSGDFYFASGSAWRKLTIN